MSDASPSTDLFELVGQEARMAILRALLSARRESDDPHHSFTELKEAAGIEDTGRFNYHLGRLVGTVVAKTDDGYRLSRYGFRVLAPMTAGLYDPDTTVDGIELPGTCHECGGSLRVESEENSLRVVCRAGHTVNEGIFGHADVVADQSPEEAAATLGLVNTQATEPGVSGVCPKCHRRREGEIEWLDRGDCYVYRAPCDGCGSRFMATVGSCVATHPTVACFLADRGVDVRRRVPWTLPFRQAGAETVVSEDPLRLRVAVGTDVADDPLQVTVDREGSVVGVDQLAEGADGPERR
ncbi:DUF7351 domain-containing protein [Halomicrococcus gelatinilyticus]|uniref:DUF7351 domain-containing protein n=1 Tax=Halomicrococcus gelatinilyticus TaxID=1702103 RepID=UPI002E158CF5